MEAKKIGFVGGGNMASALIAGLLDAGGLSKDWVRCAEPNAERAAALHELFGIETTADNAELVAWADCVVVAVKPQVLDAALSPCKAAWSADKLLVSVAAGVTIERLTALTAPEVRVLRAMPNTPALVRQGATGLAAGASASSEDVAFGRALFELVGGCWSVAESQLDAVTGLSGSGPAYVMLFIEALADGGVRAGLPRDVAQRLAMQTVLGAAALANAGEAHTAELKDRVTSPAGTTIEGVFALERGGFRHAVIDAVCEASKRATELGRGTK